MSGAIDTIGSVQQAVASTTVPAGDATTVSASSFAVADVPAASASFQNQRVIQDPSVGFITQYLSANDSQVVSQTPSAITVAYLRNGLTASGLSKQPETPNHIATSA